MRHHIHMILYVNTLLNNWAYWRLSNGVLIRSSLGVRSCWPTILSESFSTDNVFAYARLVPLNNLECCRTDKAVCELPADLQMAVMEYYTRIGTAETTAKCLGISVSTLFLRIARAHDAIRLALNGLAAGVQPAPGPTLSQKIVDIGSE